MGSRADRKSTTGKINPVAKAHSRLNRERQIERREAEEKLTVPDGSSTR
jgi:hypothetical protein